VRARLLLLPRRPLAVPRVRPHALATGHGVHPAADQPAEPKPVLRGHGRLQRRRRPGSPPPTSRWTRPRGGALSSWTPARPSPVSMFPWDTYAALRDAFDPRAAAAGMRNVRRDITLHDTCYDLHGTTARAALRRRRGHDAAN
jgi:hypothetical protein